MPGCTKPDGDGIVVGTGRGAGAAVVVVAGFAVVVVAGFAVVVVGFTVVVVGGTTTEPTLGHLRCASTSVPAGAQLARMDTAINSPTATTIVLDDLNGKLLRRKAPPGRQRQGVAGCDR
jgi:hypothetical protein